MKLDSYSCVKSCAAWSILVLDFVHPASGSHLAVWTEVHKYQLCCDYAAVCKRY